jgi:hypothetical protein
VPRWFTVGVAVHEETAVNAEWGDRLGPEVLTAIRDKKLLPVVELDRGFIHPTHPGQVMVSYFQAGRICDFIAKEWGEAKLLEMLHAFGKGQDTATVVRDQLKLEPAGFDKRFLAAVEAETARQVKGFDEWRKRLKGVAEMAKKKDHEGVIREGSAIREMYPDYVEAGSVYEFLGEAYLAQKGRQVRHLDPRGLRQDGRPQSGDTQTAGKTPGRERAQAGRRGGARASQLYLSHG